MKIEELLPIGSVVMLFEAQHALMIFGVKQTNKDDGIEYDYIGVPYPEGNMGNESYVLFNHEHIDKIFFEGYKDEKRDEFISELSNYYAKKQ